MDISNPTAPTLAGSCDTAGRTLGVTASGNYVYVADAGNGLVIVDVSNKAAPMLAGPYDTAGRARCVAVSGTYAYVADGSNGIVIVDINNPTMPTLAGHYDTAGRAKGVAVSGNYAYVVCDYAIYNYTDLVIVDISNPIAPMLAGGYSIAGDVDVCVYGVAVSGNYAYVADGSNGLVIVNISNPTAPTLAGSYDTAGYARCVAVSGNYAYVADEGNGLVILRTDVSDTTQKGDLNDKVTTAGKAPGLGEETSVEVTPTEVTETRADAAKPTATIYELQRSPGIWAPADAEPTATNASVPGFGAVFTIAGLLTIAYFVRRQQE